eukprot:GHVP01038167.1.p1 GENE.GHVP01038167.1~~GHVP01038167.1.p1  ORF type:complete len:709 (+),score=106.05 GHVP01038167.1:108-2129(+)
MNSFQGNCNNISEETVKVINECLENAQKSTIEEGNIETLLGATKKAIYRGGGSVEQALTFEHLASTFIKNGDSGVNWKIIYFLYRTKIKKVFHQKACPDETPVKKERHEAPKRSIETIKKEKATEKNIIDSVFYLLQGIQTEIVSLNTGIGNIKINFEIDDLSNHEILLKLAECGMHIGQLREYLNRKTGLNLTGPVQQGLCVSLGDYLHAYLQSISSMANEMKNPNLRMIYSELFITMREVSVIHHVICGAYELHEGGLLNYLYRNTSLGDTKTKRILKEFFIDSLKRFLIVTWEWLSEGKLCDYVNEFFIKQNKDSRQWTDRFYIKENFVPIFITKEIAHKILMTGASKYFSKAATKKSETKKLPCPEWIEEISFCSFEESIDRIVANEFKKASKELMDILIDENGLVTHLSAIQKYILLLSGNFSHALVENFAECLQRPSTSFFRNDLVGLLESAINSSSAREEDRNVYSRLDVRILDTEKNGWDCMCLQYQLFFPLDVIVTERSMQKYQQISIFLWKLKKSSFILSKIRKRLNKKGNKEKYFQISEQWRVISGLESYVFSVIQEEWDSFRERILKREFTLETLVSEHNKYLNSITRKTIVNEDTKSHIIKILGHSEELLLDDKRDNCGFIEDVKSFIYMIGLQRDPCFGRLQALLDLTEYYTRPGMLLL